MFPGGGPPPELPDNVTVNIVRHGKEPAKITVTRGDEKWEISDKELDKLPEELRPPIAQMMNGSSFPFPFPNGFNMKDMRIEGMPMGDFHPFAPGMNPPPRDGRPPRHDGDGPPPDGNPPPRDGEHGPPPPDGHRGPGDFGPPPMQPGQVPPELMERLDRLDHRLGNAARRTASLARWRPRFICRACVRMVPMPAPTDRRPETTQRGGRPPRDDQRDGPPHDGPPHDEPPPNDR